MANWIAKAINPAHKGLLHKELGVSHGKSIPAAKLEKAEHAEGKEGYRARLAARLKGFNK